jgi:hypothetical protein
MFEIIFLKIEILKKSFNQNIKMSMVSSKIEKIETKSLKFSKNTYLAKDSLNKYFSDFILKSSNDNLLKLWNDLENQNSFNKFLCENKFKMKDVIGEQKRKLEKKNKIVQRESTKQIKKVEKAQTKAKTPFFFFKKEEEELLRKDNVKIDKKMLHNEIQKKWKIVKIEKLEYYKELALKNQAKILPNITKSHYDNTLDDKIIKSGS